MNERMVAIDPLALLLPSRIYLILMEKLHPHVQLTAAQVAEALKQATVEERKEVAARMAAISACVKPVEAALAGAR